MHFAGEIFNRKIEKISNFLFEVLEEAARKQGKAPHFADFFDRYPSFLKEALHRLSENIMSAVLSYVAETDPCETSGSSSKTWDLSGCAGFSELDCQTSILRQMELMRRKEVEDLKWKLESCKLFMDEKAERLFEMSNIEQLFLGRPTESNKENRALNGFARSQELERSKLLSKIAVLEERLRMREIEMKRERMERQRVLSIEEEAIKTPLANTHRHRDIRTREKQFGERELLVMMQGKNYHVPSKSFSGNV